MDKNIITNIEDDDLSPASRHPKLVAESDLIDITHVDFLISNLVEAGHDNPKLELVYRASIDGDVNFHTICDGIPNSLMVIKAKDTGQIFGGYTRNPWSYKGGYSSDTKAFLFSLSKLKKIPIVNAGSATYNVKQNYFIVWGYPDDIKLFKGFMTNNKNTSLLNAYKSNDITDINYLTDCNNFYVEELELFKIL